LKYQFSLYKKGPTDLQDLATSRFQICMRDAVVRFSPLLFSGAPAVLFETLILRQHILKICLRASAKTLKSGEAILAKLKV
jgi:hypothetical protein